MCSSLIAGAESRGRLGELGARVHAFGLDRIRCDVRGDTLAILDQNAHGVGEVQLALLVPGVEPARAPATPVGVEDVDRRIDLVDRELLRRRVAGLDDRASGAVVAADDAAVLPRVVGAEGEDGRSGVLAPVGREQLAESSGLTAGASPLRTRRSPANPSSAECAAAVASPVPRGSDWIATVEPVELACALGRGDDDERLGVDAACGLDHPVHHSPAEQPVEVLRRADCIRVPRPPASTTAAGLLGSCDAKWLGRQDSNLGSRDQNPLPYRLATPQS